MLASVAMAMGFDTLRWESDVGEVGLCCRDVMEKKRRLSERQERWDPRMRNVDDGNKD